MIQEKDELVSRSKINNQFEKRNGWRHYIGWSPPPNLWQPSPHTSDGEWPRQRRILLPYFSQWYTMFYQLFLSTHMGMKYQRSNFCSKKQLANTLSVNQKKAINFANLIIFLSGLAWKCSINYCGISFYAFTLLSWNFLILYLVLEKLRSTFRGHRCF